MPPYEWFKRQCAFFHEHHQTDRWDLTDAEDAFQLYYQMRILSSRYLDLHHLLRQDHQYKRASMAYGKYWVLTAIVRDIFPFKDSSGPTFSERYNRVQREIAELEEKFRTV